MEYKHQPEYWHVPEDVSTLKAAYQHLREQWSISDAAAFDSMGRIAASEARVEKERLGVPQKILTELIIMRAIELSDVGDTVVNLAFLPFETETYGKAFRHSPRSERTNRKIGSALNQSDNML